MEGFEMPLSGNEKDDTDQLHHQKLNILEELLGPTGTKVLHAVVPIGLGGEQSSIHTFTHHVPGMAYVTCDLIGWVGQKKNEEWDNYELMICTRIEEDLAPNMISRLGAYTLENPLNPNETMDIGSAVPKGSTISAFFFTKPEIPLPFEIQGINSGIVLCIGITESELKYRWKAGPEKLIESLKKGKVFPFTDWKRKPVV
jgi:hypothetical protein